MGARHFWTRTTRLRGFPVWKACGTGPSHWLITTTTVIELHSRGHVHFQGKVPEPTALLCIIYELCPACETCALHFHLPPFDGAGCNNQNRALYSILIPRRQMWCLEFPEIAYLLTFLPPEGLDYAAPLCSDESNSTQCFRFLSLRHKMLLFSPGVRDHHQSRS